MHKNANSRNDSRTRYVDDGGPNGYSAHFQELMGNVSRAFRTAKSDYCPRKPVLTFPCGEPKTASDPTSRATGIVRCPGRMFASRDTILRSGVPVKQATVAGGPNPSEIEQALEQIAEVHITNKAPLLSNYMLGFQLLKKTDDDTKAVGIFAYKVGDELIYIPVFSLNGDLQGHELMYVVSRDQFVPSDEKWVNYLLSRKPLEPGRVERRERSEIPTHGTIRPTFMSSGLKLSSYRRPIPRLAPEYVLDALRTLFKQASVGIPRLERSFWHDVSQTRNGRIPELRWKEAALIDLDVTQLFRESRRAVKLAARWSRDYPLFERLLKYAMNGADLEPYFKEWEVKAKLAESLGVKPLAPGTLRRKLTGRIPPAIRPALKEAAVTVTAPESVPLRRFRFMPERQIDRLHRDGYLVVDPRDPSKLAAIVRDENDRSLCNPVGPGLYKVFTGDGTFRDCFVLLRDDPTSDGGQGWLVLDKETKRSLSAELSEIWTSERDPDPDWPAAIPTGNGTIDPDGEYEYERHRGVTSYLISPSGHVWEGRFVDAGENAYHEEGSGVPVSLTSTSIQGFKPICSHRDGEGHSHRHAPVITSKKTILRRYKDDTGDKDRLTLGSRRLWTAMLLEGTLPVTIRKRQGALAQYAIDGKPAREKSAALATLMRDHHLSQETAEQLIRDADRAGPRGLRVLREKTAFSGPVPQDRFSVTFPQKDRGSHDVTGATIEQDLETEEPIEALRPTRVPDEKEMWPGLPDPETDSSSGPPAPNTNDMNLAAQASRSGQKDFVSSQMLLSLLREIDNNDLIAKYITTFEKACDTLGRLYMQVLWRTDSFEERFGRTQLKEFKEMLVSLFQELGDFICYLRQRDVRPAPVLSMSATNIEEEQ